MTKPKKKMRAADVVALLERRHSDDLFASEALCGPHGALRLDGWAMPRSWTQFRTIGYEVKVARGDWLTDRKFESYLDFVHELYLVCPWGLIQLDEVPQRVGLIYVTKTGTRLVTKKRAPAQEAASWTEPVLSLAINRGFGKRKSEPSSDREACEAYAAQQEADHRLGMLISDRWRDLLVRLHVAESDKRALDRLENEARRVGLSASRAVSLGVASKGATLDEQAKRDLRWRLSSIRQSVESLERSLGLQCSEEDDAA